MNLACAPLAGEVHLRRFYYVPFPLAILSVPRGEYIKNIYSFHLPRYLHALLLIP